MEAATVGSCREEVEVDQEHRGSQQDLPAKNSQFGLTRPTWS